MNVAATPMYKAFESSLDENDVIKRIVQNLD